MQRLGRPLGLIRYSSREILTTGRRHFLRPRVVVYPLALTVSVSGLVFALETQSSADVTVLRGLGAPYTIEPDGRIANQLRVRITNRAHDDHTYHVSILGLPPSAVVIAPQNPMPVHVDQTETMSLFILSTPASFQRSERPIAVQVSDGGRYQTVTPYNLLGPRAANDDERVSGSHGTNTP
jgi:polyferredoxin